MYSLSSADVQQQLQETRDGRVGRKGDGSRIGRRDRGIEKQEGLAGRILHVFLHFAN